MRVGILPFPLIWVASILVHNANQGLWQMGWDDGIWNGIWDGMGVGILPFPLIWVASIAIYDYFINCLIFYCFPFFLIYVKNSKIQFFDKYLGYLYSILNIYRKIEFY